MSVNAKEILVANIRREMKARGLTQKELANDCGWPQARLAEVLTGEHTPRLDTVDVIARALATTPSALLMPLPENSAVPA
jgi:transcriptional regulator with XRE-family HTH domain